MGAYCANPLGAFVMLFKTLRGRMSGECKDDSSDASDMVTTTMTTMMTALTMRMMMKRETAIPTMMMVVVAVITTTFHAGFSTCLAQCQVLYTDCFFQQ